MTFKTSSETNLTFFGKNSMFQCSKETFNINFFLLLYAIIRFYYSIDELSKQQHTSDIALISTKLTKLTTFLLTIYYFQLLSYWDAVPMLTVIQFQTFYKTEIC